MTLLLQNSVSLPEASNSTLPKNQPCTSAQGPACLPDGLLTLNVQVSIVASCHWVMITPSQPCLVQLSQTPSWTKVGTITTSVFTYFF